jgi:hypothetical protein
MKYLILSVLLMSGVSNAQNLSTYDRVFPKTREASFGQLMFGAFEAIGGLYAAASLTEETESFWKKLFPKEHTRITNADAELDRLKSIVSNGKGTEEINQAIRDTRAELNQARHDVEILKLTKLKEIGIEGDYTRQTLKRIKVYGLVARGIGIYMVVDGVTRFAAAVSSRDPGFLSGLRLIPLSYSEVKEMFSN